MKKTKTVRFNETADVYQSSPIRIKDAEDIIATQPVKSTEDSKVTIPATSREDSKVTEPVVEMHSEETVLARQLVKYAIAAAVKSLEEDNYIIKNVKWITHGAFTTEKCRRQIDQFVSSWEYEDRWVHYTKLNETRDLGHSFHYIYAVRWSAPTAQSPLALASTYTFFTVKFNKNKPPDAPVDVSYCFERQLLIHRPGRSRFREIWAKVMVEGKDELMESLPF
ncbi:A-kinase anchor protein 14 [Saccopteryx bilineata]|uniref:A-kinase anchor protein 14 n=1 Tax=Saccopteryx bilineata TaxID=59482 RepID=UPI00338F5418